MGDTGFNITSERGRLATAPPPPRTPGPWRWGTLAAGMFPRFARPLFRAGFLFRGFLRAQVIDHLLENLDELSSLRLIAGAPGILAGALVCELIFESGQGRGGGVGVELTYVLMRENIPVVFGSDRNAGALRSMPRAPFVHSVAEFPSIRRNLFLLPLTLIVVPFVSATDFHAGVFFPLEDFELVVRLRRIFFQDLFLVHGATP